MSVKVMERIEKDGKVEKKHTEFEEAVELSKELLQQSSKKMNFGLRRFRSNLESKMFSGNNVLHREDSGGKLDFNEEIEVYNEDPFKTGVENKAEVFEQALEWKYKEFIRRLEGKEIKDLAVRVQIFDNFERQVRDELRTQLLGKFISGCYS
jgi:hypothetical protein